MTQPMPCHPDGEPIPCRGCQYFTGPGCGCDNEGHTRPQNPGPRPGLDEISSDDLDTLYDRADNAEAEVDRFRAQLTTQTQRAMKAERAVDHLADRCRGAEAEVQQWRDTYGEHALRRTLARLHDAETTVDRLRALAERWQHTGDRKNGPLRELRAVLDQHGQTPKETT